MRRHPQADSLSQPERFSDVSVQAPGVANVGVGGAARGHIPGLDAVAFIKWSCGYITPQEDGQRRAVPWMPQSICSSGHYKNDRAERFEAVYMTSRGSSGHPASDDTNLALTFAFVMSDLNGKDSESRNARVERWVGYPLYVCHHHNTTMKTDIPGKADASETNSLI